MNTLAELVDLYVRARRDRGDITRDTARNIGYHLDGFVESFGARPLTQLTRSAVERWQGTIGELSPATRRGRLSSVRGFCRWLAQQHYAKVDATQDIPPIRQPRSVPRALPLDAVTRLLNAAPDLRAKAILWLMVGLGLRCVEVARLEYADYDRRAGTILVTGKYLSERLLPVSEETRLAIDEYLASTSAISGPLIRSYRHPRSGLRPDTISQMVSKWMTAAGIKDHRRDGVSAHALRHTAASDVLDKVHDLRVVQQMLGHERLATTAIYLRRVDAGQLREAMEGRTYGAVNDLPERSLPGVELPADSSAVGGRLGGSELP